MLLAEAHRWNDKLENGFTAVFGFIPELLAAIAILVIGYFVAKVVARVVARLLDRAGLDRTIQGRRAGRWMSSLTASPSQLLGRVAFWALFLGAVAVAVRALGIEALTDFVAAIFGYLPNVIAAFAIFLVAGALAAGVSALVGRTVGDTATGRVVGSVAPVLIMAIAGFMILDQLKIAEDIVRITYAALVGAIALGLALAFGLGGREVAARMLEGAYQRGQESKDQIRRDIEQGRARARAEASREETPRATEVLAPDTAEGDAVAGPSVRVGVTEPAFRGGHRKVERIGADELGKVPPGSAEEVGGGWTDARGARVPDAGRHARGTRGRGVLRALDDFVVESVSALVGRGERPPPPRRTAGRAAPSPTRGTGPEGARPTTPGPIESGRVPGAAPAPPPGPVAGRAPPAETPDATTVGFDDTTAGVDRGERVSRGKPDTLPPGGADEVDDLGDTLAR